jgi:hypothetical protein
MFNLRYLWLIFNSFFSCYVYIFIIAFIHIQIDNWRKYCIIFRPSFSLCILFLNFWFLSSLLCLLKLKIIVYQWFNNDEATFFRNIVDCYACIGIPHIVRCNRFKPFLASCVPHLHFYYIVFYFNIPFFAVWTNCAFFIFIELVLCKSH